MSSISIAKKHSRIAATVSFDVEHFGVTGGSAFRPKIKDVDIFREVTICYFAVLTFHNVPLEVFEFESAKNEHVLFDRLIDDVEKIKERTAKDFFLYPARKKKDGSQPSFVEKWRRVIISQHDAEEHAKLEYMTKAELVLWQRYFESLAQKKISKTFYRRYAKPMKNTRKHFKPTTTLLPA